MNDDMPRFIDWSREEIDFDSFPEDEENEDGEPIRPFPITKLVHTNFGLFELNSIDNPYNTRDCWIANTNFTITKPNVEKISQVQGVEAIRVISRYSFTIMIGMMFYFEDVLDEINYVLDVDDMDFDDVPQSSELIEKNAKLIAETLKLVEGEEFYNVYIFPNGKTLVSTYESEEELLESVSFHESLKRVSNGILLTS